jgi:hypothetical protein
MTVSVCDTSPFTIRKRGASATWKRNTCKTRHKPASRVLTITQAGFHRPLNTVVRVQSLVSQCEISGGQSGIATGSSPSISSSPFQYHSTNASRATSSTRYQKDKRAQSGKLPTKQCSYIYRTANGRNTEAPVGYQERLSVRSTNTQIMMLEERKPLQLVCRLCYQTGRGHVLFLYVTANRSIQQTTKPLTVHLK